jgi:ABC-2 type transport system permease protein
MPVVVFPQLLLCGLFQPRTQMATVLSHISDAMPMSYAVDALQRLSVDPQPHRTFFTDLLVVAGCALVSLVLAAATMRRSSD